jgi:hypothetical protein
VVVGAAEWMVVCVNVSVVNALRVHE